MVTSPIHLYYKCVSLMVYGIQGFRYTFLQYYGFNPVLTSPILRFLIVLFIVCNWLYLSVEVSDCGHIGHGSTCVFWLTTFTLVFMCYGLHNLCLLVVVFNTRGLCLLGYSNQCLVYGIIHTNFPSSISLMPKWFFLLSSLFDALSKQLFFVSCFPGCSTRKKKILMARICTKSL